MILLEKAGVLLVQNHAMDVEAMLIISMVTLPIFSISWTLIILVLLVSSLCTCCKVDMCCLIKLTQGYD